MTDDLTPTEGEYSQAMLSFRIDNRPVTRVPGHNVDRIDVAAGMRELAATGWDDPHTTMVIEHSLTLWARGEEDSAQRKAIDSSFHGIDLTSWLRVLAAAMAAAEPKAQAPRHDHVTRDIKAVGQCPACDTYHLSRIETVLRDISTIPVRDQPARLSPSRFPVTYAYDFYRSHAEAFGEESGLRSRGDAATMVRAYCERTGQDRGLVVIALAMAYLRHNDILTTDEELDEALAAQDVSWLPKRMPNTREGGQ